MSAVHQLVGRDRELAMLTSRLDLAAAGGCVVSISGDAGVGKSAMLGAVVDSADSHGFRVLSAVGSEFESDLPFAALHQLLRPVLDRAADLPGRQRDALLGAFGVTEAGVAEAFLVALATLQLLSDLSEASPVIVAVDDAQWLDRPSRDALSFVLRRFNQDPVALFEAHRSGYPPLPVSTSLDLLLTPLDGSSASRLLDATAPALDRASRNRILATAAGNPLALVELPRALEAVPHGVHQGGALPMTTRLEAAFSARATALTPAGRLLALLAAADSDCPTALLKQAAGAVLGSEADVQNGLAELVATGLVSLDSQAVTFRHPLMRSAVYHEAGPAARERAHLTLAESLRDDPDRRAWHLAAGNSGFDDDAAAAVEAAALRARQRGAGDAALTGLQRAAELSSRPQERNRRYLRAAETSIDIGKPDRVYALVARIDRAQLTSLEQARLALVRQESGSSGPGEPSSVAGLLESARTAATLGDTELATRFVSSAAMSVWWADPGGGTRQAVLEAGRSLGLEPTDPRLLSIYAHADPRGRGREVLEYVAELIPARLDTTTATTIAKALGTLGAFDVSAPFQDAAVAGLREEGSLGRLPEALCDQTWTAITMMRRAVAIPAAQECIRLAEEVVQPLWAAAATCGQAMLAGLAGDSEAAQRLADEAESVALPMRVNAVLCGIQLTRGTTALGEGRYEDAYADLQRVYDPSDPAYHHFQSLWTIGDFAEAASHVGRQREAAELIGRLASGFAGSWHSWVRVASLYAAPLLADDDVAEQLFRAALSGELSRWPAYRARLLLEYGSWARRRRDIRAARIQLRAAREACDALGMVPWAQRARRELRAAGEPSDEATAEPWTGLSPQELQIAQLAATGLTNREIAQRLFISHRTVSTHLYRIYPKLGVTTRNALARYLAPSESTPR